MQRFLRKLISLCCRRQQIVRNNVLPEHAGETEPLIHAVIEPNTLGKLKNWCLEIPRNTQSSSSHCKILKQILSDANDVANTVGLLFAYLLYAETIRSCDPNSKDVEQKKCINQISSEAGYIGIALASLNFLLRPLFDRLLINSPATQNWFNPAWRIVKDIIGRHAFLLFLILALYTEIIRAYKKYGRDSPIEESTFAFIVEAITAAFLAAVGNRTLRNITNIKLTDFFKRHLNLCNGSSNGNAERLSNASFNAVGGFAFGRGIMSALQNNFMSDLDSTGWQIARYISGGLFFILSAIAGWIHDPNTVDDERTNYESILFYTFQVLNTAFFVDTIARNTARQSNSYFNFQYIAYILIILATWIYSFCCNPTRQNTAILEENIEQGPQLPPSDSTNSQEIAFAQTPQKIATQVIEEEPALETKIILEQEDPIIFESPFAEDREALDANGSNIEKLFTAALRPNAAHQISARNLIEATDLETTWAKRLQHAT